MMGVLIMKFLKSSFQNKLYISCFLLNLIFLCICSTAFYYYTASSLKRNMEDSLVNNTFLLMKDLDTLLDTGDNTLKDLQTNSEFFSEAKKITPSSENYFTKHIPVRSALQNTFRSALFLTRQTVLSIM